MRLKKIIKEKYSLKKHFPNINDAPGKKILKSLESYSSPLSHSSNIRDIPSIPGGRIYVIETISTTPGIHDTDVFFHYLKGSSKEDLDFVRNIIYKNGLKKKSLENPTIYDII